MITSMQELRAFRARTYEQWRLQKEIGNLATADLLLETLSLLALLESMPPTFIAEGEGGLEQQIVDKFMEGEL